MKKMQKFLAELIVLVALPAMSAAAANPSKAYAIGDAFGLKSNDLVYREIHCGTRDELASEVFYRHRDGTLIAYKELDYRSGHTTPSFVQHNFQAGEKIQVSFDQETVSMSVTDYEKRESKNTYPVADISGKPIVIDAGFDGFIRDNWDKLVSGEMQEFQFPLASRSSLVSLQVKPSACSYETETDQCFTLESSNWFFRMLASPIELGYDASLARLTRYRGLSNINDKNGRGLVVDIKYRYQANAGTACNTNPLVLSGNVSIIK
jgi:hypothetical protein